eukprot:jgi/Psemu1/29494/gm1.29494_g
MPKTAKGKPKMDDPNTTTPPTEAAAAATATAAKMRSLSQKVSPTCQVNGPKTTIPPAEASASTSAAKTRSLSQKFHRPLNIGTHRDNRRCSCNAAKIRSLSQNVPPAPRINEPKTTIPSAEAATAAASYQPEEGNAVLPTAEVVSAAAVASHACEEGNNVIPTANIPIVAPAATALPHVATAASTATLSCGGEEGNIVLPTAVVTEGDAHADTLLSDVFENDSEYKVHVEVMQRHGLQPKVMGENVPVVLGAIPRVIDMMVNLFLCNSGEIISTKVNILDATQLTTGFNNYKIKDKCHIFQRVLNSVIQTNDSTGRTEYTRIEGEDKLPDGKLHAVWSTNVVNYKTILKYMKIKVHFSITDLKTTSLKANNMSNNSRQGSLSPNKDRSIIALVIQCVSKRELAFQTVLMSLWAQFQQTTKRFFPKVKLNHFINETFLHGKLYEKIGFRLLSPLHFSKLVEHSKILNKYYKVVIDFEENLVTLSTLKERDIFVDDLHREHEEHIKTLLQQLILTLCWGDNFVSKPTSAQMLNSLCNEFLDNVLTSWLSHDPTVKELIRGYQSRATYTLQEEENWKQPVTRLLNFNKNCQYTVEDRLFCKHMRHIFFEIFITHLEILICDTNFLKRSLEFLIMYNYLPVGGKLFTPLTQELQPEVFSTKKVLQANLEVGFVSEDDENNLKSNGLTLSEVFKKISQLHQLELFSKNNDTYSVGWLMFTNKGNDGQLESDGEGFTNELEGDEKLTNKKLPLQPKVQRLFLRLGYKCKKIATEQSNQSNKHKERKVSPNLDHVENPGYTIQVLLSDVDPKIESPCYAIGSKETIKDMPPPETGVVKSYGYKKNNQFPLFPGYMVYKKKPDGTQWPKIQMRMKARMVAHSSPMLGLTNQKQVPAKFTMGIKHVKRNNRKMENKTQSKKMKIGEATSPQITMFYPEYNKWTKELGDKDLNPPLYHFETGFNALCAINGQFVLTILDGCKQTNAVRTILNSKQGKFDKEEALSIWEEAVKYVNQEVFPDHEEGSSIAMDHMWAMGVILLLYLLCSYSALKGRDDIKCYSNLGIGPERAHKSLYTFSPIEPPLSMVNYAERVDWYGCLCGRNGHLVFTILDGCKLVNTVRTRLNSRKGRFEEEESSLIWKEALDYAHYKLFPNLEKVSKDKVLIFATTVSDHTNFRLNGIAVKQI